MNAEATAQARITEFALRWNCGSCGGDGWSLDADGRPVAKCPDCSAPTARDADRARLIRRLIATRANEPGAFTISQAIGETFTAGNEVGGIVSQLAAAGVIVKAGAVQSGRVSRRSAAVAVWVGAAFANTPAREPQQQQLAIRAGAGRDGAQ